MRQEAADLIAARAELTERVAAGSEWTEHQRHRAETPEQHASRAVDQVDDISRELTTTREQLRHWQSQTAGQRAELAGLTATRTAMHRDRDREAHSGQRLADQQTRHEKTVSELRTQLREAGHSQQQRRASRRANTHDR